VAITSKSPPTSAARRSSRSTASNRAAARRYRSSSRPAVAPSTRRQLPGHRRLDHAVGEGGGGLVDRGVEARRADRLSPAATGADRAPATAGAPGSIARPPWGRRDRGTRRRLAGSRTSRSSGRAGSAMARPGIGGPPPQSRRDRRPRRAPGERAPPVKPAAASSGGRAAQVPPRRSRQPVRAIAAGARAHVSSLQPRAAGSSADDRPVPAASMEVDSMMPTAALTTCAQAPPARVDAAGRGRDRSACGAADAEVDPAERWRATCSASLAAWRCAGPGPA
jgi:hypothetical protein